MHMHKCACAHTPRGSSVIVSQSVQVHKCIDVLFCKYVNQLARLCVCKHILMTYTATTRFFVPFVVLEAEHEAPAIKKIQKTELS